MFRDFVYIDFDYSVRVQDGYFIFRWWRSYVPKDVSEGKCTYLFIYIYFCFYLFFTIYVKISCKLRG